MRVTQLLTVTGVALLVAATTAPLRSAGPSFRPDKTFTASTLDGWHSLGDAEWRAEGGALVGTPSSRGAGWLVLDRSLQDAGFYASFLCASGCETGVLLRAEKTADGLKGIYVALNESALTSYRVTIDTHGRLQQRTPLPSGGGQMRIAPPSSPDAPARGAVPPPARGTGPMATPPVSPPDTSLKPGEWNTIEIYLDANIIRPWLNDGNERGGVADPDAGSFGPIALYAGGTGQVRFKDVAYKDLSIQVRPPEEVSKNFRMQRLSDFYYAWGAGAADIDHDNVMDLVSGPHVFYGPDYTRRSEIYLQLTTNPSDAFTTDDWMQFVSDFTGDGWADALNCSFATNVGCFLYVNPKREARRWDKHLVVPAYQTEIGVLSDLDGDGRPELVYGAEGQMRYARPDPANPTGPWIIHNVSERGLVTAHGVGAGDINGDGRPDIVNPFGWWEQPPPGSRKEPWDYHPEVFTRYRRGMGGSVMAVYDVNGDKLNDVVTVLATHGWGMAWFEQKRDARGTISFEQHMIMDDLWTKNAGGVVFSQPHGSNFGDVNGDGITDFIVGKRYWSHRDTYLDPDPYGPAVLYWYKTVRNPKAPGGAEFVPELIHNRSGTGSDVLPVDLNKDGRLDIVTATRFGTFIFWNNGAGK
jgi:3-keto-disaccharide hydrolase/VCBS repeat protein